MAVVFAKLAPDLHRHPKIRKGGRDARDVFVFALCVNADHGATGIIGAAYVDPWYLSDALLVDQDTARRGLEKCIEVRLLEMLPDGSARIVGWDEDEWGRARHGSMTEAERKALKRAEVKAARMAAVRTCPDKDSPVSGRPDMSRESETDQRQSRSEAEQREESAPATPVAAPPPLKLEAPGKKPRRQSVPKAQQPPPAEDPEPSDRDRAYAAERGVDLAIEWSAMFDHHRRKSETSGDWSASWRTWCRNHVRFAAERSARAGPAGRPSTGLAATAEILADRQPFADPFKPRGTP